MLTKNLSIAERIEIVEELWDSIAEEQSKVPVSEEQKRILDERLNNYEVGLSSGLSWDEVKEKRNRE
jgi:putative addiction module component (TIGR02574 family)